MLLVDLSHTARSRARSGVQQAARGLFAALGDDGLGVCHDPYTGNWRALRPWEQRNATAPEGVTHRRSAEWPFWAKVRGTAEKISGSGESYTPPPGAGLVVPEVFSAKVGMALPALLQRVQGPRVAVFHDALPMQWPELAAAGTVARFPSYLRELLQFDGIAADSQTSADVLAGYWRWLGIERTPPITVIGLGVTPPANSVSARTDVSDAPLRVLCVGSLEPRKNHAALLDAAEALWSRGRKFELHLIGLATRSAVKTLERIRALQAAGRPLRYDGPVDDAALTAAYEACSFTVYPSLAEGYGLPLIESLVRGKPCVCSATGAVGEIAHGGGCIALPSVDAASIATGMDRLLADAGAREQLATAARARRFPTWHDYVGSLRAWINTLARR